MKLKEIELHLKSLSGNELIEQLNFYSKDERIGVQKLCVKMFKHIENEKKIQEEWEDKLLFDSVFHNYTHVLVGIDEVGRGPLAGPVVAAAVVLPYTCSLVGLKDSKKIPEAKREALYNEILETAVAVGIGIVEPSVIDQINILQATFLAMKQALEQIDIPWDVVCVDGDKVIPHIGAKQHAVIKGDDKSGAIAAASVVAKVTRDRMMKQYSLEFPYYDWDNNKGYGSAKHYEAIKNYGVTPLHRKSFLKGEDLHE